MELTRAARIVLWVERGLAAIGIVCLTWAAGSSVRTWVYQVEQHGRIARLSSAREHAVRDTAGFTAGPLDHVSAPIGRLAIPRIGLFAVVMEGDDEDTLKIAVGHLPDTPLPWQEGNSALAGHRDTFFRSLRHLRIGDEILLETARGTFRYRSTRQTIVEPHELWVLDPSPVAALTLITCYPFNFVGPAPRRFVVHAERMDETSTVLERDASQEALVR